MIMYHSLIHVPFHDLLIITFWYNKHGRLRIKYDGSQLLIQSGNLFLIKKKNAFFIWPKGKFPVEKFGRSALQPS